MALTSIEEYEDTGGHKKLRKKAQPKEQKSTTFDFSGSDITTPKRVTVAEVHQIGDEGNLTDDEDGKVRSHFNSGSILTDEGISEVEIT